MDTTLEAVVRESRGKNEARRLRVKGQIPAVVYGGSQPAQAVAVSPKELSRLLHSEAGLNTLIDLKVDGTTTKVIVKDFLLQPVTHQLLHADFYRVNLEKKVQVKVAVRLHGEPKGVKVQGGVLDFVHREIEVESLPTEIPEHIDIDVTGMMIGDGVHVKDVAAGQKWTPVSSADMMIVHVVGARVGSDEAAGAATAEPEVAKKGKTDKDK
ncbi:50S ribosomal protein L25 [Luteitalea sp. TBR-22]|uniref:50S ribosomal protein L25 n=1 Tax=Luteitalea sp. TBR-22 TaxID=2802971 RepID=UPI001AFC0A90|nr:50S ribosomal protein L25 [Luteitalea sp. TBR-22]BCS34646.1 50S ribosomal protein L25 [Luteitalea sp. TBR-22]